MSRESRYSTVSPVDIASRRSSEDTFNDEGGESLELERVHRDDGSEVGLTAPSSYAPKSSTAYSKSFKTNEQTRKLFFPQFWRWIGTVALIGLMLATLKIFQHMGNFSNNRKHVFNTIITALSLGLGINFLVRSRYVLLSRRQAHRLFRRRSKTLPRSYGGPSLPAGPTVSEK